MKIVIATTLWKRAAVEITTLRRFANMRAAYPEHEITLLAIGSEGDKSRHRAESHGWVYDEFPNLPLGAKHNRMIQAARDFDPDAFMCVGSDNWISDPYLGYVIEQLEHHPLIGLRDVVFSCIRTKKSLIWPGYAPSSPRHGSPVGPSRVFRRDALETLQWELWNDRLNRSLDGSTESKIAMYGLSWHTPAMRDIGSAIVDWKSDVNIWSYSAFERHEHEAIQENEFLTWLQKHFGHEKPPTEEA